jgi:hypothetical protein
MIGMGAVVTRDVEAHTLVIGNPARVVGLVCACGEPIFRGDPKSAPGPDLHCEACDSTYHMEGGSRLSSVGAAE